MSLACFLAVSFFVYVGSNVAFISLFVLFFLPLFFWTLLFFINFSYHVFSKLWYNCIKLFTYFVKSFEIMARFLITPSFYLIVGNIILLCFLKYLFFLVAACYRSCVHSFFLNDMSFLIPTICRRFLWERSQGNIRG